MGMCLVKESRIFSSDRVSLESTYRTSSLNSFGIVNLGAILCMSCVLRLKKNTERRQSSSKTIYIIRPKVKHRHRVSTKNVCATRFSHFHVFMFGNWRSEVYPLVQCSSLESE